MIFPRPFEIENENGTFPAICFVEHARNKIPASMDNLGLTPEALQTHIAWDIGIEKVTRIASAALGIPAIYCLYSRLIVDVNRPRNHPEIFWPQSDGVVILNRYLHVAAASKSDGSANHRNIYSCTILRQFHVGVRAEP